MGGKKQIDQLVYKLYGLTEKEIKVVEGLNLEKKEGKDDENF